MTSLHLIGGGRCEEAADLLYGPFLAAAAARRAGGIPVVACLLVDEGDGYAQESFARHDAVLRAVAPCAPVPVTVPAGRSFDPALLGRADALLVGGGLTPAYQQALAPVHAVLPALLRDGAMPYAGFSAGAAVASRHALVGGWTSGGVAVCPRDAAEDLDEIEVRPGLGLVPFTVDVHAAQWGTLSRLVEAVRRGDVPYGVAIDEDTRLTVHEGRAEVSGLGAAHLVRRAPAEADGAAAVSVGAYRAGRSFPLR